MLRLNRSTTKEWVDKLPQAFVGWPLSVMPPERDCYHGAREAGGVETIVILRLGRRIHSGQRPLLAMDAPAKPEYDEGAG